MEEILGQFLYEKSLIDPLTGKPLSKSRRIENMYAIINGLVYDKHYTKDERLLAVSLIKQIIEEE